MKLLIFGLGYSARAIVNHLLPGLETIWATTRTAKKAAALREAGIDAHIFPSAQSEPAILDAITGATHILHSIAPTPDGDPVLAAFAKAISESGVRAICYLSTVGVYGDHNGDWVEETTQCRPRSDRTIRRLRVEKEWLDLSARAKIPVSIIRLAGIYGPGRGPQEKLKSGNSRRIIKPGQVFNRIHVDDIAQIVAAAFDKRASGIFNGADDEPAPPQDVIAFAADQMGLQSPPEIPFADAELSAMARSFYGENKRVRNDKIKSELGVVLKYPTYREGLSEVARL